MVAICRNHHRWKHSHEDGGLIVKVKTAGLSGVQLDYAVAVALGVKDSIKLRPFTNCPAYPQKYVWLDKGSSCFSPSSNWMACGPLIEQFKLSLYLHSEYEINGEGVYDVYEAGCSADWFVDASTPDQVSTDPKVAICRAVVASKLGDEVDIPDELMESK